MQPNGTYYYPQQSVPAQFASAPYPPQLYPVPQTGFANYAQGQGPIIAHPPYAYPPYPQAFAPAPQPYIAPHFGQFHPNASPDARNVPSFAQTQPRPFNYPPPQQFRPVLSTSSGSNSPQTPIEPTPAPSPNPSSSQLRSREDSPLCSEQINDLSRFTSGVNLNMSASEYSDAMRDLGAMTVDRLKKTITRFNESFACHMRLNGLKNDLYTRVRDELNRIYTYDRSKFPLAKSIISQVRQGYASSTSSNGSGYGASSTATATAGASGGYGATTSGYGASTSGYNHSTASYNAAIARPPVAASNGLPPPRFGASTNAHLGAGGAAAAAANRWQNDDVPIKFRPSPFYRVEKSLSPPVTLYKAEPGDRKSGSTNFGLTEAQRTLLSKARESPNNPQYEVRLYCTSDNNYSIGRPHASQFPAPIEFPQTCEIKLNGVTVNANTKGIKKQPGTTPPVNLSSKKGPTVQIGPGQLNKIEVIYTNTEKITYYMVAYLIETTPINKVVEKVKAGRTISKEEVIQSIKDLNSDEEIAAGPLGLSLKDPLSFSRIGVPVRSKQCKHISCFDAETWFEMNEQTPTWNCPICSKTLKFEEMVVDGYFEDILKMCPNSVEAVTVNPDGTWRSDDNKHGTGPPRASKTSTNNSTRNSPHPDREESTKPDISGKGKAKAEPEALLLDSDSDDEPLAKRPRIGGYGGNGGGGGGTSSGSPFVGGAGSNGVRNGRGASEVLDLTLDDSDEDDAAAAPPRPTVTRPSMGMARTSSGGGGEKKTIAEVQRDIDAMNKRMREEYGENWKTRFNIDD